MTYKNKKRLAGTALEKELEAACRGLVYMSETDRPISAILEALRLETTLREFVTRKLPDGFGPVRQTPASFFFDRLTADRDWHSAEEKMMVGRFRRLESLLAEHLTKVTTFKAGRVQIEIFVIGRDDDGNIAGIRTTAVET